MASEYLSSSTPTSTLSKNKQELAVFEVLAHQSRVKSYLETCVKNKMLSHAYLFCGEAMSDVLVAAQALAQALVCPQQGCAVCHDCLWVAKKTHPDVHVISPEGSSAYLVEQLRDLIDEVSLRPVRANMKVYIIEQADLLFAASANALLKTLEEPPADTVFILLTKRRDAVLQTIVSRCQIVPFAPLDTNRVREELMQTSHASEQDVQLALWLGHDQTQAQAFLQSAYRQEAVKQMLKTLLRLAQSSTWDLIVAAEKICAQAKLPIDEMSSAFDEQRRQNEDFLFRQGAKRLEERHKRELTANQRSGMIELIATAQALLRELLVHKVGQTQQIGLPDYAAVIDELARNSSYGGIVKALEASQQAEDDIGRNVTPQLVIETMLITIKEALTCPASYR